MFVVRRSNERGDANHGWLKSRHTFSFAGYYDPKHMGFKSLRVINEDRIAGGTGFGAHPHRDMEIISYVVKGALEHKDSMGTKAIIRPGEVQRMSAGSGITHSEQNHESNSETHFFQIWIMPKTEGGAPGYGQKSFEDQLTPGKLVLVASEDSRDGSIGIRQDADLYVSRLSKDDVVDFNMRAGRGVWIQVVKGQIAVAQMPGASELSQGDAVAVTGESKLTIRANEASEFLLFDLA